MSDWLSCALQTVRDKSLDALDFVKKDLSEFTTTVKSDTETYINKIKTQEVGDLGINRFVSKFSNSNSKPDDTDEKHFHASSSYDRVHTEMTRLQNDESTYLVDPTPLEAYEHWRQTSDFNIETRKGEIAQLLIDTPHVRSFYAHLVPAQTTHVDFWLRYYYRLHQIEDEEARRLQLLQRAKEICSKNYQDQQKTTADDWEESDEETEEPSSKIEHATPIETTAPIEEKPVETIAPVEEKPVKSDNREGELDETDNVTSKTSVEPDDKVEEPVTTDNSNTEKKTDNELDDEWEAWS